MKQEKLDLPFKHMGGSPIHTKADAILNDPAYASQEKMQGIRGYCISGNNPMFATRGKLDRSHRVPHLLENLPLLEHWFDGEAYIEGVRDEVVAGIINGSYPIPQPNNIRFAVFDLIKCPDYPELHALPYHKRHEILSQWFMAHCNNPNWDLLTLHQGGRNDKISHYQDIVAKTAGIGKHGEGIMLKNLNREYNIAGKKPANIWYKWKFEDTWDVIVTGFTKGQGKYEGMIGAITFGLIGMGEEIFEVGQASGMTDKQRLDMTENPGKFLDKVIEVSGAEVTSGGKIGNPQFIRVRDDKDRDECTMDTLYQ